MRYSLNLHLIRNLDNVLGLKIYELRERSNLNRATWDRLRANEKELTMEELLMLSNSLRIPVHHFISMDETCIMLDKSQYVLPRATYKTCWYDFEAVQKVFGNGRGRLTWARAGKVMNVIAQTMSNRFNPRDGKLTSLTAAFFLESCNRLGINADMLLHDPNEAIPDIVERDASFAESHVALMENTGPTAQLEKRMERIERRIEDLENFIAELRDQLRQSNGSIRSGVSHASLNHDMVKGRLSYDIYGDDGTLKVAESGSEREG